jgi:hypothetical protein
VSSATGLYLFSGDLPITQTLLFQRRELRGGGIQNSHEHSGHKKGVVAVVGTSINYNITNSRIIAFAQASSHHIQCMLYSHNKFTNSKQKKRKATIMKLIFQDVNLYAEYWSNNTFQQPCSA